MKSENIVATLTIMFGIVLLFLPPELQDKFFFAVGYGVGLLSLYAVYGVIAGTYIIVQLLSL
jgi:hypothetical protein